MKIEINCSNLSKLVLLLAWLEHAKEAEESTALTLFVNKESDISFAFEDESDQKAYESVKEAISARRKNSPRYVVTEHVDAIIRIP